MNALDLFLRDKCVGKQYDSCIESPCLWASRSGCAHPDYPRPVIVHDFRDRGDPGRKVYPTSDWRSWEHNQQPEHIPGCGRR